jgi:hypothetical protein
MRPKLKLKRRSEASPRSSKTATTFDRSAHMKALWADPEHRDRWLIAASKVKTRARVPHPNQSAAISRCWADPVYRAKRAEGTKRMCADRAANPAKYSRVNIPNGMRKAEAMAMWERASTLADEAMRQLQERGILPASASLDLEMATDEDIANLAIREALKMTLGPSTLRDKLDAARLVLTYTMAKPPTVPDTRALIGRHGHHDQTGLLRALMEANTAGEAASTSDGPSPAP